MRFFIRIIDTNNAGLKGFSMTKKRNITTVDLARELGVDQSTVSRALADSPLISKNTKRRVLEIARKLHYSKNPFANGLRTGQTRIIDLLYNTSAEHLLDDPMLLMILDHVQYELKSHGYRVMLNIIKPNEYSGSKRLASNISAVDGTIVVSPYSLRIYKSILEPSTCVLVDNAMRGYSSVAFDFHNSLDLLIQHLLSRGHKKIAALTLSYQNRKSLLHRVSSYKRVCLKYQQNLTNLGIVTISEDEDPFPMINKLKSFPDAVVCLCDIYNLKGFAHVKGVRIPEDLGIAAIADSVNLRKYGQIPHVRLNWSELVHRSILCLLEQIEGESFSPKKVLVQSPLHFE